VSLDKYSDVNDIFLSFDSSDDELPNKSDIFKTKLLPVEV